MELMISIFGSSGFIGSRYSTIYKDVFKIDRNDRKPKSNDILYFMSFRFVGGGGTPYAVQNVLPILFNMSAKNC